MRKSKMGFESNMRKYMRKNGGKRVKQCVSLILVFALLFTMWAPDLSVYADYNQTTLSGEMYDLSSGSQIGISAMSTASAYESIDTAYFTVQGDYADTVTYTASLYINNTDTSSGSATSGVHVTTVGGSADLQPGRDNRKEIAVDLTQNGKFYVAAGECYSVVIHISFNANDELTIFGYNSSSNVVGLLDDSGSGFDASENFVRTTTTSANSVDDTDITLTADKTVLATGEATNFTATLSPDYLRPIDYSVSGDGSVLDIDSSAGIVTAGASSGSETVTATVGSKTSSVTFYVVEASMSSTNYQFTGSEVQPDSNITVKCGSTTLAQGTDYDITYTDNVNPGTATAKITGKGTYSGYEKNLSFTINSISITGNIAVNAATIDTATSTVSAATIVYTNPDNASDTKTLEKDVDYTVTAVQQSAASDGITYKLTVNGIGGYTGSQNLTYKVAPSSSTPVDIGAMYTAKLSSQTYYAYTKTAIKPSKDDIAFYYKGTDTAVSSLTTAIKGTSGAGSADVLVSYGENINAGTGTITLTGQGKYTGEITIEFTIVENDISDSVASDEGTIGHVAIFIDGEEYDVNNQKNYVHDGSEKKPNITAQVWNGSEYVDMQAGTDFGVEYRNNIDIGQATIAVNGLGSFSGTYNVNFNIIGDLANDSKITFKDSSYVNPVAGKAASTYTETFDGTAHTGVISAVQVGSKKLTKTSEGSTADGYYLTYTNNVNAGTATVRVNGTGIYAGMTVDVTFNISARPLSSTTDSINITDADTAYFYNGAEVKPTYTVVATLSAETTLVESQDYTASFSNNVDAGTATMTIEGKGNYSGTLSATYTINKLDISKATVTYTDSYVYTGSAITLSDLAITYNGVTIDSSNYTVSYTNNTQVGSKTDANPPTATITGKGDLTGEYIATFTISSQTLNGLKITAGGVETTNYGDGGSKRTTTYSETYDGKAHRPTIAVWNSTGSKQLTKGTDYSVTYTNNTNAGAVFNADGSLNASAPYAIITGKKNYAGSIVYVYFTINPRPITASAITVTDNIQIDATDLTSEDATAMTDGGKYIPTEKAMTLTDTGVMSADSEDTVLERGVDYTVVAGTGGATAGTENTVVVSGAGNYTGSREVSYAIGKDIGSSTVSLLKPSNGTKFTALTSSGLYDISYLGNVRPGVSITYQSDSDLASYVENDTTGKFEQKTASDISLSFDSAKGSLDGAGDYAAGSTVYMTATADASKLAYYGSVTVGYYIDTLSIEDASVSLTSFGEASGFSVDSSDAKTFHITYNGKDNTPVVATDVSACTFEVVSSLGGDLTSADYRITSSGVIKNAGTYTITLTGKKSYTGSITLTIIVDKANLGSADVVNYTSIPQSALEDGTLKNQVTSAASSKRFVFTQPDTVIYTGSPVTFQLYVWDTVIADETSDAGYYLLKTGNDNLTWSTSATDTAGTSPFTTVTNPGTKQTYLVAKADSNYTGYIPITVVVEQRVLSSDTITLNPSKVSDQLYDGTAKTPLDTMNVIYTNPEDKTQHVTLTQGTDYNVTYTPNVDPGLVTVTISAVPGNEYYSGTYTTTFGIYGDLSTSYYTKTLTTTTTGSDGNTTNLTYNLDSNGKIENFKSLITNKISVTDDKGNALTAGTDYTITVEDSYGNTATSTNGTTVTYETSESGSVQGLRGGEAAVYITGVNSKYYTGTVQIGTITLTADLSQATVDLSKNVYYYTGSNITVNPSVKLNGVTLQQGKDYKIVYDSVSEDGVVDVGKHSITIEALESSASFTGQITKDNIFTVKYNLNDAEMTLTPSEFVYDGTDKGESSGKVNVAVTVGGKKLTAGDDYILQYPDSDYTSAGQKTIVAKSTDATPYSAGSKSATFTIGKVNIENAIVTLDKANDTYTYTGLGITPQVSVTLTSGTTLTEGTDFKVDQYINNVNVAGKDSGLNTPTVVITGIGNYAGTIRKTFTITQADISNEDYVIANIDDNVDFAGIGNAVKPNYSLTNKATGKVLVEGEDYTVSNPSSPTTNFGAGTNAAYIEFTGTGTNYSGTIKHWYTINAIDLSTSATVSIDKSSAEYTGAQIDPVIKVTVPINGMTNADGSQATYELQEGTDYTITRDSSMKNAGNYTIIISGTGTNFVNTKSITFTITPRNLSLYDDTKISAAIKEAKQNNDWTGSQVTLTGDDLEVVDTGLVEPNPYDLVCDTDYTIRCTNNVDAGTAILTITGKGNYTGSRVLEYNIGESIEGAEVTLEGSGYTYDGTEKKPGIASVRLGDETLTSDQYTVTYETDVIHRTWDEATGTSDGMKTVTISGNSKKGFYGSVTKQYEITPKTLSSENIVIKFKDGEDPFSMTYTGSALEPEVEVYDYEISKTVPIETYDYDVSYRNNVETTRDGNLAYVDIKLKNDYNNTDAIGAYSKAFSISPQALSEDAGYVLSVVDDTDGLDDGRYHWTGSPITPEVVLRDPDGNIIPQEQNGVTNYTVKYTGVSNDSSMLPINSGACKATIEGANNFGGVMDVDYIIYSDLSVANSGTGETTIEIPEQFYLGVDGESLPTPTPTVISGGNVLESGINFETTYTYDGNVGHAKITAIADGTNNFYTNDYTCDFIMTSDTDNLKLDGVQDVYIYDGKEHNPLRDESAKIVSPSGTTYAIDPDKVVYERLKDDSTYETTDDFVNAGTIRATVPLSVGGQEISVTATYTIRPKTLRNGGITVKLISEDYYSGRNLTPYPSVFYDTDTEDDANELIELKRGTDYTLSYSDNKYPGQAAVEITGIGNYSESTTRWFGIVPADPAGLSGTAVSSTAIQLSWRKDSRVDGYVIYAVDGTVLTQVGTTQNNTYAVTGLDSSTTYTYAVASYVTVDGVTSYSVPKNVQVTTTIATPTGNGTSSTAKQAVLTLGGNPGESIKIYRSTSRNGTYTQIATVPAEKGTYVDSGLTSGKTYYYKLQAYRQIDGSWYGSTMSTPFSVTVK